MLNRNERESISIPGPTSFRSMAGKVISEEVIRRVNGGAGLSLDRFAAIRRPLHPAAGRRRRAKARPRAGPPLLENPESGSRGRPAPRFAALLSLSSRPAESWPHQARPSEDASAAPKHLPPGLAAFAPDFSSRQKPFAIAVATSGLARTPFTFYPLPFQVRSLICFGSVSGDPVGRVWRAPGLPSSGR